MEKGLRRLLDEHAMDELMISTKIYDHTDRRHSYELLAKLARCQAR